MYAIVETGGKQYRVEVGDTLDVEKLPVMPGEAVELDCVLLVSGEDGARVGQPLVSGAVVRATVMDQVKGEKVIIFNYKPKERYRRRSGHRQRYTRLRVDEIVV